VRLGVGIGLLPLGGCVTHMKLERVLPDLLVPGCPCSLVYPSSRHLPQRVRLLRDALIAMFSTHKPHFVDVIPPAAASLPIASRRPITPSLPVTPGLPVTPTPNLPTTPNLPITPDLPITHPS
jgi:hypothetical protein